MQRFANLVVLITGVSSGIGAATALRLASEGARVYGLARNVEGMNVTREAIERDGGTARMAPCELSDPAACQQAVADCISHYGQLDVLVNCAGGHIFRKLEEVTAELWHQDIAINLGGAFFLSQAAIPHLLKTGGNIVNIGSLASVQGQPYSATYCSAKHGIIGLTKALALEFINENIRINALCPGGTNTPQIGKVGFPEDADFDLIMRTAGIRGMSEPEDIAAAIAFLASSDAKAVHGAVYMADQGKTIT